MISFGINNIVIVDVKRVGYRCIIHGYRTYELINNRVYNYYYDLVTVEELKFKNIMIGCKS